MAQRYATNYRRLRAIQRLEKQRSSRVITLIHRQESIALLGLPLSRFIDIDDSEALLRAIRLTPDNLPIDLVIHTPGRLVLTALNRANTRYFWGVVSLYVLFDANCV